MPRRNRGKIDIPLMVASIFLAFVLWLFVQTQSVLETTMQFQKPLEIQGLDTDELVVTSIPGDVVIEAEGTREQLDRIDPNRINATVNLANIKPGPQRVRVELKAPSGPTWSLLRPYVDIVVERLARRNLVVEVVMQGELPEDSDLIVTGATARPESVTVYGPVGELGKVARVRARLDLREVRAGEARSANLEILDEQNRPVSPLVQAEPSVVVLQPAYLPALSRKNVVVDPVFEGQPAPGYRVKRYVLRPSQVTVRGTSETLAGLTTVNTQPVNIGGLMANTTRTTRLRLPRGVSAVESRSITVEIEIEKAEGRAEPPPPDNDGDNP